MYHISQPPQVTEKDAEMTELEMTAARLDVATKNITSVPTAKDAINTLRKIPKE